MTTKIKLSSNVSDVDLTTTAPTNGQGLIYNSTSSKWVPGAAGGGVTVYDTIDNLPLSGVSTGALALVDSTNKLYLWMDTGWYNIATINTNPSITGGNETPYILATDGTPTEITLIASDPEGIPLTWSYEVTSGSLTNGGGTTATVSNDGGGQFKVTPTTTEAYAGAFSLTFKASDGVNLGTTVAAFTLAFRIPDSNYTTLLAKGVAATQNATFVDSRTNPHTITRNGDVYQGTFSPYRAGGYSMYFDGTGDYLTVPASSQFLPGVDTDFTFEAWVYLTATPGAQGSQIVGTGNYGVNADWSLTINSSGITSLYINVPPTGFSLVSSTAINLNEWNHIAVCRSGTGTNNLKLFINGGVTAQASTNITLDYTGNNLSIGSDDDGNAALYTGYISNLRLVVGTAVYTSNFTTPTEPLTAITNTSLLINTPYIADSTNAHAITVNGNTSTKPFSPFDYKVYDATVHGGSAYFDGTDDLSIVSDASTQFGSGDFTIETWFNASIGGHLFFRRTTTAAIGLIFQVNIGGTLELLAGDANIASGWEINVTGGTVSSGSWHHAVLVRQGSSWAIFLDGSRVATATASFTIGEETAAIKIGTNSFTGYLSNYRIVKGTAVYDPSSTSITVPTVPLTAITSTGLLLNFTNAGVQDYSQVSNLKLIGNATGSNTQTKYAAYSMYFDGTGDYIIGSEEEFGSLDLTWEMWIKPSTPTQYTTLYSRSPGSFASGMWTLMINFSGSDAGDVALFMADYSAAAPMLLTTGVNVRDGSWHHIAVVRNGSSWVLYVDGTSRATQTWSGTIADIAGNQYIGYDQQYGRAYAGYIEDLRITKGLARYPTNPFPTDQLLG